MDNSSPIGDQELILAEESEELLGVNGIVIGL